MSQELAKQQCCLIQRNGVQIWIDAEKAEKLQEILISITEHKFIRFYGRTINTADCTGVYLPEDIENLRRYNNGQRQCSYGKWHGKNEKCNCISNQKEGWIKLRDETIANCGHCNNGYISEGNTARLHDCMVEFTKAYPVDNPI